VKILTEFREFAIKGNAVDMAVGIIIGAAFSSVVKSIVTDVFTPGLALLTGNIDFTNRYFILRPGTPDGPYTSIERAREAGAVVLGYGKLANEVISFLLVAMVLFLLVRWMNRLRRPDTPPAPTTRACPFCMSHIDKQASRCPLCTSAVEPVAA
jgi:large conductance mechanosensitive channel